MPRIITACLLASVLCGAAAAAQGTMTAEEFSKGAAKAKARQQTLDTLAADQTAKTVPKVLTDEEKKARAEQVAFNLSQGTAAARRARSPQGLLIVGYKYQGGALKVRLQNISASSVSLDGTQLVGTAYDSGQIFEGGSTSGVSLAAGETREIQLGFIGTGRRMGALTWKGVSVWVAPNGQCYRSAEAAISEQRARETAAVVQSRAQKIIPVKEGYVQTPGDGR